MHLENQKHRLNEDLKAANTKVMKLQDEVNANICKYNEKITEMDVHNSGKYCRLHQELQDSFSEKRALTIKCEMMERNTSQITNE